MNVVSPIKSKKQIDAMILALETPRDKLLFILGINSGLRIGDILKLTVGDVRDTDMLTLVEKETGQITSIPLNNLIQEAVSEYITEETPDDQYLFLSQKRILISSRNSVSCHIDRTQAFRILHAAAKRAGIEQSVSCLTLRKTFGYHAYYSGLDITTLQKLFNHASQQITLRFIGIEQDDIYQIYPDSYLDLDILKQLSSE